MGTSNFYSKNARHTFAVLMNQDYQTAECNVCLTEYDSREYSEDKLPKSCCQTDLDWEDKVHYPERYEIDDFKDNIRTLAQEKHPLLYTELSGCDNSSNFTGHELFELSKSRVFMGVDLEVMVIAVMRSGYYEGACLDWETKLYLAGNEYHNYANDYENIVSDLTYYGDNNIGLARSNAPRVVEWFESTKDELTKLMDDFFCEVTDYKLNRVCTFSNGETIYEIAKD